MPQIFHPVANTLSRFSILGAVAMLGLTGWLLVEISRSDYVTGVNVVRNQPVDFSHQHHVGGLGIDCRYCHTGVEDSSMAGMPPTETCMQCHRSIWRDSPKLALVRESFRTGRPIRWTRVHDLPDFVYFDHGIHVKKGVACVTCHGRIDQMPLVGRAQSLHMKWCLDCHRNPEQSAGGPKNMFDIEVPSGSESAEEVRPDRHLSSRTHCSACHR